MSSLTNTQKRAIFTIENTAMRRTVELLVRWRCEVLIPGQLYRIGETQRSRRDLHILVITYGPDSHSRVSKSKHSVDLGIDLYERIVGSASLNRLRKDLCEVAPDSAKAYAMAREIASWSLQAETLTAEQLEYELHTRAHIILRWVENVKRRIMGLPLEFRQEFILDLWGAPDTFKTITVQALTAPLRPLVCATQSPAAMLRGRDGMDGASYLVFHLEGISRRFTQQLICELKHFICAEDAPTVPGRSRGARPMLASLICEHRDPPEVVFPDGGMPRRLGSIHFSRSVDDYAARRLLEEKINAFDIPAFWQAVDPINRASSDDVIWHVQEGHSSQEPVQRFMEQRTRRADASTPLMNLFAAFRKYAQGGNIDIRGWTNRMFADRLRALGYELRRRGHGTVVVGLICE